MTGFTGYKRLLLWIGVISILSVYIAFLALDSLTKDLGNIYTLYLKYSAIIVCFIMSLFIGEQNISEKDKLILQWARFFTLLADYFLVIINKNIYGILCFCMVQLLYIIRHSLLTNIKKYKVLIMFIINILILVYIARKNLQNVLFLAGGAYGSLLLCSCYTALSTGKLFISAGMFLFLLCDINVALYNITGMFIFGFLIWLFYLPSQLLLTLSGFKRDKNIGFF